MFKNYFVTAFRNVGKSKFFSFLNILGLSVGITVAIMVGLYVFTELSVDKFNEHYDNIYRIECGEWFNVPAPIFPIIRTEMLGLVATTPTDRQNIKVIHNNEEFYIDNAVFTEPDFLDIFTINILNGDGKSALNEPGKILLSESYAKKIFGNDNPLGKQLKHSSDITFTVEGIFSDFPENSHISIDALAAFENRKIMTGADDFYESWQNWNYQGYVRLNDGQDPEKTITSFNKNFNLLQEMKSQSGEVNFNLRHLRDIYFHKDLKKNDFAKHGNMQYLLLFTTSALLTLTIAVINFINLSTARSGLRAREIGIRKVNGAGKRNIIKQFMSESLLVSIISFLIAIILVEIFLPYFNNIVDKNLSFSIFRNLTTPLFLLAGILTVTLFTGLYPALFISSFNTLSVLKKTAVRGKNGLRSRRFLMIFQFVITISLILGTLVIYNQMKFMVNKDLGYDKEHILYFRMSSNLKAHQDALKQKLLESPAIQQASIVFALPGNFIMEWGRPMKGESVYFTSVPCDEDYIPLLDLKIVEGRNFDPNIESDKNGYIVNEAFVRKYNLKNPLSVQLDIYNIIGVVKDFTFQSLHHPIRPMAFTYFSDWSRIIAVKVLGSDIENAKEVIKTYCREFSDQKIEISFLDDTIEAKYVKDKQFSLIFNILSLLAIFISSLGLLGLISFEAHRRTKEIGIRKVLGATPLEIIHLFNKELFILLGISSVLAWIVGYFWLTKWLQNFAFRISIGIGYFIASAVITTAVALITFSFLSFRAATANPVDSIKYE